jgi:hypothetical protein
VRLVHLDRHRESVPGDPEDLERDDARVRRVDGLPERGLDAERISVAQRRLRLRPLERPPRMPMSRGEHGREPCVRGAVAEGQREQLVLPLAAHADVDRSRDDERDSGRRGEAPVAAGDPERGQLVPVHGIPRLDPERIEPRARHPGEELLEEGALLCRRAVDLGHQPRRKSFAQTSGSPVA